MKNNIFSEAFYLVRKGFTELQKDDPFTRAGALAYFTVFAIPPVLIVIISAAGFIAGEQMARDELFNQIRSFWGEREANLIRNIVNNYAISEQSLLWQIISIAVLIFSSTSLFVVVQSSINRIWKVRPKPRNDLLKMALDRILSFCIVLILGALLIISFVLESVLVSIRDDFDRLLPGISPVLFGIAGYVISFLLLVLMFAIIYKFLPDVIIKWKVVWIGATITAFLFTIGRLLISFYLSQSSMSDVFGIAGSLVLILLWIFYSAIILFYGAALTQQYALRFDGKIKPKKHAVRIEMKEIPGESLSESGLI